jgi:2-dehydropantoate 2-reductase
VRIAILGAGAMGSLFGGLLSQNNDVWLVDINQHRINKIRKDGITIIGCEGAGVFHPSTVNESSDLQAMDLVIVFVKAMHTLEAINQNKNLINDQTFLMSMQNGVGHEKKLLQFTDKEHVIIGITQHNASINEDGIINHGGSGSTVLGLVHGDSSNIQYIADNFTKCNIQAKVTNTINYHIWQKLFLNTAASSLTALLQVPLGYILDNPYANEMMVKLAQEAVNVANRECDNCFVLEEVISDMKEVISHARNGYTSIYSDLKEGRLTEVDTISGSVISIGKDLGVETPYHEAIVSLIHALEGKNHK